MAPRAESSDPHEPEQSEAADEETEDELSPEKKPGADQQPDPSAEQPHRAHRATPTTKASTARRYLVARRSGHRADVVVAARHRCSLVTVTCLMASSIISTPRGCRSTDTGSKTVSIFALFHKPAVIRS